MYLVTVTVFSNILFVYFQVKHDDMQTKEGGVKMVPEVFLPRLLATKVNNGLFHKEDFG